eukprot:Skav231385  [mRNA]  locus=scaffold1023:70605:72753:+ [translate_table: standard]
MEICILSNCPIPTWTSKPRRGLCWTGGVAPGAEYGQKLGASYVMKMDDDTCVNGSLLLKAIDQHVPRWRRP